ncbi:MAG TPA: ECF transporter S component [Patescibacteria group bacterium]
MIKKRLTTKEIALAAGLSAISAVLQLIHIGYQSPQFGMWIDIVAVTWIIGLFLFGLRMSFIVSLIGAIIITLFAPDTWLGASMKWLASFPVWFLLGIWAIKKESAYSYYKSLKHLILPILFAMVIRCIIIIPVNYYYAIPIWTGLTAAKAMVIIPWYIIALFNIVQTIVDVAFAWIIVYKFRLDRFLPKE